MSFGTGLLEELAEYEAFQKWRQPDASAVPQTYPDAAELPNLKLLLREILRVAASTSGAASIANYAEGLDDKLDMYAALEHLCFGFSTASHRAMEQLSYRPGYAELTNGWLELETRHSFAMGLTKAWAQAGTRVSFQNVGLRESSKLITPDALADAWRRASAALVLLLDELALLMPHASELQAPREVLRQAMKGAHPCIDREGCLSLPGWAERRRETRIMVDIPVVIEQCGRRLRAVLVNASVFGLGLKSSSQMMVGEAITINALDGRRLLGVVQWSTATAAGIALDEPLPKSDPWLKSTTELRR